MRSLLAGLLLGMLAGGCFDDDILVDTQCAGPEDCSAKQDCVQILPHQPEFGWCRPEGEGCKRGEQPGCDCLFDEDTGTSFCTQPLVTTEEAGRCICIPESGGSTGY